MQNSPFQKILSHPKWQELEKNLPKWVVDMKVKLRENTPFALSLNLAIIASICLLLLLGFFEVYLPLTTHHGQTITVPNLEGMPIAEVEKFLDKRDLRFVVADSGYDDKMPALSVMKQDPLPNARVKVNRRIHLTIRALNPPKEAVPDVYDNQVKQADQLLESRGFKRGKITYVPDIAKNAVLRVYIKGKVISREQLQKGFTIEKGTQIDLEVGDGLGNNEISLPDFRGKPLAEVEIHLRGLGLGLGSVIYEKAAGKEVGTVLRQNPAYAPNHTVRVGDVVDLWVAGYIPEEKKQ
jgi:eukaryotic-like serine/threonine-protein kinase